MMWEHYLTFHIIVFPKSHKELELLEDVIKLLMAFEIKDSYLRWLQITLLFPCLLHLFYPLLLSPCLLISLSSLQLLPSHDPHSPIAPFGPCSHFSAYTLLWAI